MNCFSKYTNGEKNRNENQFALYKVSFDTP